MAGFYMIETAVMKELKANVTFLIRNLKGSSIISDKYYNLGNIFSQNNFKFRLKYTAQRKFKISLVNVNKSVCNCGLVHIY